MNPRALLTPRTLLLPVLALIPSCAGVEYLFSPGPDESAGFVQVDDLLSRVERIHVDCELSGQNVSESMTTLLTMVGPEFHGDPAFAYEDLMAAIELSEKQAKDLRNDFGPMQKSAELVFESWRTDLEAFASDSMRQHSQKRMIEARERYEAVVSSVGPAMVDYEAFNQVLRDHALYLGNDFNGESVALIEAELRSLIESSNALSEKFDRSTEACQDYVRKAALRGQVTTTRQTKKDV